MYERSSNSSARYCEETEKMAIYMAQLNQVYEKMIHAMTINMYGANPMAAAAAPVQPAAPAPAAPTTAPAPAPAQASQAPDAQPGTPGASEHAGFYPGN